MTVQWQLNAAVYEGMQEQTHILHVKEVYMLEVLVKLQFMVTLASIQ